MQRRAAVRSVSVASMFCNESLSARIVFAASISHWADRGRKADDPEVKGVSNTGPRECPSDSVTLDPGPAPARSQLRVELG